jgi:N12 class adenine-specific DNA methylase/adenine-specific DNA methylase
MLHDKEEGLGSEEVAKRYFQYALYGEGEKPNPYRKEPEKLVENINTVLKKASDAPDRKRPVLSLGPQHSCYQMMYYLFPDLLDKDSNTTWLHYKMEGFDDLNVEHLYDNVYSIAHTFVQNGDVMNDPSMEVRVDDLLQVVDALDFRNDSLGFYQDFRDDNGIPLVSKQKRDAEDFLLTWLKNIDAQGYVLTPNLAKQLDMDSDTKIEQENNWSKLNPDALKQHLEQNGVLHGEVIDEENLQKDSLVQMIETSVARPEADKEVTAPNDNFVISDDSMATGTPKVRFQKNMEALHALFRIEEENRAATEEEKVVLCEYSGWGGLSAAFDEKNESWHNEYVELKKLLPEDVYQSAIGSTLNAHYTGAEIIRGVYQMLSRMGFSGGKILEPSMGTGHFFGLMPESMAQKSTLTGVELDSISGRIAQLLYPSAKITIDGFEKTNAVDSFDLAVGNVPFGKYGVSDSKFNSMNLTIHNYFFVKALDEVRPGGLVCFLTSRYTMDAKDSKVRRYLAERAELVSAVRFPQDAFKDTANAEVVTDLLVFQKKAHPEVLTEYPDWVSLGLTEDDIPVNEYFLDNPDHVFGTLSTKSGPFGPDLAVLPKDRSLSDQFASISVPHVYAPAVRPSVITDSEHPGAVPADPSLRDFSYGIIDGKLFYREEEIMYPPAIGAMPEKRIRAMIGLASKMHTVIDLQMNGADDPEIEAAQAELNSTYDSFVKSYQRINNTANSRAFSQDSDYFLLCGLEILDSKGKFVSKADIFSKRTISPTKKAVHCETAEDAMVESIRDLGHIDIEYMNELLGWGEDGKDRILKDLSGVIFRDPDFDSSDYYKGWETADQYLSGNVRVKLEKAQDAASNDPRYTVNVEALQSVQPEPIEASDISIRLGATWIKKSYYEAFMRELFQLKGWQSKSHEILFEPVTGRWRITEKNYFGYDNVAVNETYGTERKNAAYILEDCLNLSATIVYDSDGHGHSWKNEKETQLAQMKQEEVKRAFADWIMKDPVRRKDLTDTYNRIFNSTRERTFDGSYLKDHLPGINTAIQLRPHQLSAVSRTLLSGNTLLAHAVGAGKTFEMIASAMEAKRLGPCHKSMFVVPNHLVEQWGKDFLLLYPGANILVADKKTFSKDNRKKFTARIAAGDYDAVIIGHSQFQMIPLSDEMQEAYFNHEINSAVEAITRAENEEYGSQKRFTVQQLQQFIKSMQHRLDKIMDKGTKDDVIRFEKLGVDRLYVDEAHNYKNLYFYSKLSRIPGVNSGSDTNKTLDLAMKVNYINKLTDYRGVVFATGTPVSNSVSECYTMMKYLEPQVLEENGFNNFDAWATTFGEVTTAMELAPEGNGFRMKQRFAKFYNVPELMKIFREVSDIKVPEDLQLDVPEAERETIVAKPSKDQKDMMEGLTERAEAIHKHMVDPSEDNMLKITTDGRKIGLDPRLIDPDAFDDPESKINLAVEKIYQIWDETKKNKSTQMVFCDFSVPGKGGFNVYDDMKDKLIKKGIPAEEIEFIHNANSDAKKEQLFSKVRAGNVRILFGSTAKMGEGTNCQERLIALHHLDAPWKPSELDQRDGRIIRQGNTNPKVHIYTYVTEGTFDAYLYQTLLRKQKFIGQIMTNKTSARQMDDVDDRAMNYAEIMAVTAGSPELREKLTLDNELASLRELRTTWKNNRMRLEDKVRDTYPETIRSLKARIEHYKTDKLVVEKNPLPAEDEVDKDGKKKFVGMEVNGKQYSTVTEASDAIHAWANAYNPLTPKPIGHYRGFEVLLRYSSLSDDFEVTLQNSGSYKENLGKSGYAFFARLDHILDGLSDAENGCTERLASTEKALEDAKVELTKPFPQEEEYQAKEKRLTELNAVLSLNDNSEDGIEKESEEKTDSDQKAEEEEITKALSNAPENFLRMAKSCDPDIFSTASIPMQTSVNLENRRIGFRIQFNGNTDDYHDVFAEAQRDHSIKYYLNGEDGIEKVQESYRNRVIDATERLYQEADVPIENLCGETSGPSGHMVTLSFLEKGEQKKLYGSLDNGSLRLASEDGVVVSDSLRRAAEERRSRAETKDIVSPMQTEAVAEPVVNVDRSYHGLKL